MRKSMKVLSLNSITDKKRSNKRTFFYFYPIKNLGKTPTGVKV